MVVPLGLQLVQELLAANGLVGLADAARGPAQTVQRAQEASVRLVLPTHEPGAAPSGLAQLVEPAVVADPEVCVRLDVVPGVLPEASPPVEEGRVGGDNLGDGIPASIVGLGQRGGQRVARRGRLLLEDRLWRPLTVHVDVAHRRRIYAPGPPEASFAPPVPWADVTAVGDQTEEMSAEAPAPVTRLVLVRHAVTEHTGGILSGRSPGVELSEDGRHQAKALGERLAGVQLAAVYASPIERTLQTAEVLAAPHGLDVQLLDGVLEADYGEWTGRPLAELAKSRTWTIVQRSPSRARFPGGESLVAMQVRVVAALDEVVVRHPGEAVVVVSHADPIKAAVAHYTGMHLDLFQRLAVGPASVTVLAIGPADVTLLKCNDTGSLEDLHLPPAENSQQEDGTDD